MKKMFVICKYKSFYSYAKPGTSGYDYVKPIAVANSELSAHQYIQHIQQNKKYGDDFTIIEVPCV